MLIFCLALHLCILRIVFLTFLWVVVVQYVGAFTDLAPDKCCAGPAFPLAV